MNYLKELNAFRNWLFLNEMPTGAIVLWHALISVNNSAGWKKQFNAPNSVVQALTGLSKQGLIKSRGKLIEKNFVRYKKGKRGSAPIYEMVSLINIMDQSGSQTSTEYDNQTSSSSLPIPKQKLNQKQKSSREEQAKNPFIVYEQNFGILRPIVRESMIDWCNDLSDQIVIEAMRLTVKRGGRTFGYIEEILKEWSDAKLVSIDQVRAYEMEKAAKRHRTNSIHNQTTENTKSMFDELRQEGALS
ncbi:DnaD domain-containing protein [Virgibacillus oceani]|uniref:DnaB/C C-terminal domain-containing protein n=1 Tax=Virgibacillus oceani TaxID=1479511 RepID=A0A917HJM6_9BACI|nr:DnaD domain protein [Virgibacillus oceani]GGG81218.1 hypothetical protein GCM10011398_28290 [Virgibacillus oceani]